jgi:hypothetical protein
VGFRAGLGDGADGAWLDDLSIGFPQYLSSIFGLVSEIIATAVSPSLHNSLVLAGAELCILTVCARRKLAVTVRRLISVRKVPTSNSAATPTAWTELFRGFTLAV